jgi:hypothetical protein
VVLKKGGIVLIVIIDVLCLGDDLDFIVMLFLMHFECMFLVILMISQRSFTN